MSAQNLRVVHRAFWREKFRELSRLYYRLLNFALIFQRNDRALESKDTRWNLSPQYYFERSKSMILYSWPRLSNLPGLSELCYHLFIRGRPGFTWYKNWSNRGCRITICLNLTLIPGKCIPFYKVGHESILQMERKQTYYSCRMFDPRWVYKYRLSTPRWYLVVRRSGDFRIHNLCLLCKTHLEIEGNGNEFCIIGAAIHYFLILFSEF